MSMTTLRTYFRTHLNALALKEWKDGFNTDNIPDTVINNSYHLEPPEQFEVSMASEAVQFKARQKIIVFVKGFNNPAGSIDKVIQIQENILKSVLKNTSRLTQTFKNLKFVGTKIDKSSVHTDSTCKLTMDFEADVYLDF